MENVMINGRAWTVKLKRDGAEYSTTIGWVSVKIMTSIKYNIMWCEDLGIAARFITGDTLEELTKNAFTECRERAAEHYHTFKNL